MMESVIIILHSCDNLKRCVFLLCQLLPLSLYITDLYSQNIVISSGSTFSGTGGTIITASNLTNNGSFINNTNTVILTGTTQVIGGVVPSAFYNLTVNSGNSVSAGISGQTVSGILLCNGLLSSDGNFTLLSDASGTALIDGSGTGQVTGNLTMQRYLPSAFGYKYFSSPFLGATVSEFGDEIDLGSSYSLLYRYDEGRTTSGWVSYKTSTNPLIPLSGYAVNLGAVSAPGTIDLTGVVNNGDLSVTLYNHNNAITKGFNLVGNPYPSPIDWDASSGWLKTNIDNALYYFKASTDNQWGGAYVTYIGGVSSDGIADNIIPSLQGFFVHVSDGTWPVTGYLEMNNSVRIRDNNQPFLKSGEMSAGSLLRLLAGYSEDSLSIDPAAIYTYPAATYAFDGKHDALKLYNTDLNKANLFSIGSDGSKLSINSIPVSEGSVTIPLGLKIAKNGNITFRIKDISGDFASRVITLTDVNGANSIILTPSNKYTVNLISGEYLNRFYLCLAPLTTGSDDQGGDADMFSVYSSHGLLIAEINHIDNGSGTISLYNMAGQKIFEDEVFEKGNFNLMQFNMAGVFIAVYATGNLRVTRKIVVVNK